MSSEATNHFFEAVDQLRLGEFAEWARGEGGPIDRDDQGRVAWYDPDDPDVDHERRDISEDDRDAGTMKPLRASLEDSTIEQDKVVLRMFAKHVATHNDAKKEIGKEEEMWLLDDRAHLEDAFADWHGVQLKRDLKPSTLERYLVTMRRYARFRGLTGNMLRQQGPFNRRRRTEQAVLTKGQLTVWLATVSDRKATRVGLATWLLLAGVSVSRLTVLRYGIDLVRDNGTFKLLADNQELVPVSAALAGLLEDSAGKGEPVLRSKVNPADPIPMPTLRVAWDRCRTKAANPTMRDLQVLARRVRVDRLDGELTWLAPGG